MNEFNFYINVDECLNMSNFEMFFYKLQNEDKFYVVEASFNDDMDKSERTAGVSSIQSALYRIKNYIGQSSFLIRDYRLIFGVRQQYKKVVSWRETVLYRLLKIHYSMQDAKLFIKTKDRVDKNVTVILLYDVDNTLDEKNIPDEISDNTPDIPALMEFLGVDWGESGTLPAERDIVEAMRLAAQQKKEPVTLQFVNDFYRWYMENELYESENETKKRLPSPHRIPLRSKEEKDRINRFNNIYNIVTFISNAVGAYCVFTKTISSNTGDHRLALLGIVDYITTGLVGVPESETNDSAKVTLKSLARENWKNAKDDKVIWEKYGKMMASYEGRMLSRQREMAGRVPTSGGRLIFNTDNPMRLSCEYDASQYEEQITNELDRYEKSLYRISSESSWEETENKLKAMLGELELSLEKYSETISAMYKREIRQRNEERKAKKEDKRIYDTAQLDDAIQTVSRRKQGLLEELKKQKMAPHVQYQDQLNVDQAIRKCSNEIRYYRKRRMQITAVNFLLLLLTAGVFVLISHLLLQESLFVESMNLAGAGACAAAALLFMLFSWAAPGIYFRNKMSESVNSLKAELITYTRGYTEIARNFEEYMNIINAIDVMNHYLEELGNMRDHCHSENRKYLWHKEAIGRHQKKCDFFRLLYKDPQYSSEDADIPLNLETDVIHNPFYWPQSGKSNSGGIL